MIDWTLPVETTEDPPRPVRVLFDKNGVATAVQMNCILYGLTDNTIRSRGKLITLRNVAPAKPAPVLLVRWINLYNTYAGSGLYGTEKQADSEAGRNRVECRRIAWMSDGSPVPSEASGDDHDPAKWLNLVTDRDHWKAKAEALQAEVERLSVDRNACLDQINALNDDIEDMRPVVDAAVAWTNAEGNEAIILTGRALMDASHAYQSQQAPAEPVKNCTTCLFYADETGCDRLLYRHCSNNLSAPYHHWEPRHD